MFSSLKEFIEELKRIKTIDEYEKSIHRCLQKMKDENYDADIIQNVNNKRKYNEESMLAAKENLIIYLESLNDVKQNSSLQSDLIYLERYLQNFYIFIESFREIILDKRATLTSSDLQNIKIENEYDLQHLLYAILNPLYIDIRKEVSEDSGIEAIRSDVLIPSLNTVIEMKCTRKSMSLKKLVEEMEADIVHYNKDFIFFYIFDKAKIIKERVAFDAYFNHTFDGKEVRIILCQPFLL